MRTPLKIATLALTLIGQYFSYSALTFAIMSPGPVHAMTFLPAVLFTIGLVACVANFGKSSARWAKIISAATALIVWLVMCCIIASFTNMFLMAGFGAGAFNETTAALVSSVAPTLVSTLLFLPALIALTPARRSPPGSQPLPQQATPA